MAITNMTAGAQPGGASGAAAAAGVVPSGAARGDYTGGGAEYAGMNDTDADDLPMKANGSADGHADCVPAGGPWPVTNR